MGGEPFHPVRNDTPLPCRPAYGRIRSQNNSAGVRCPTGISNGVQEKDGEGKEIAFSASLIV
jgi:hypothetical protein